MFVTSDTLQAADLQGKHHVVIIDRVVPAKMTDRQDQKKVKGVLNVYFRGKNKPLVCKAELSGVITKLVGSPLCKQWIGHAIEIYPTTVFAYGANHEVVRISPKKPTSASAQTASTAKPDPESTPNEMVEDEIREGGPPSEDEMRDIAAREAKEHGNG